MLKRSLPASQPTLHSALSYSSSALTNNPTSNTATSTPPTTPTPRHISNGRSVKSHVWPLYPIQPVIELFNCSPIIIIIKLD